ncbi:hypothetical protein H310_04292 [Aphanomyces invadans]|uniref:Helicase C-terminal domain-containing protein n=1 Tax=Aphanomyces invadans TaxID=157072 RepID=A0A024UGN8_9STRA|nr:hypothetical protein H310_04292 [Aphanomyces invadans]ETW05360.1 hypothetical protein H310_04292 [Aphanomyces invadans]|eukprot:XP_008866798.1 hypothetical protein H310_04292 [Aphanomyces invadans]
MEEARVEGLLALLRDGQTASIREHAAKQLGVVVTPDTLPGLLAEIRALVRHPNWDTRVAAAQAVGCIAASLCPDLVLSCADFAQASCDSLLQVSQLDMDQLLTHATPLLKSGGEEYNYTTNYTNPDDQQKHLARQRYLLWKRIAHDVQTSVSIPRPVLRQSTASFLESADVNTMSKATTAAPWTAPVCTLLVSNTGHRNDSHLSPMTSTASILLPALVQDCLEAMFDAQWEVRHGAVAVLRQVLMPLVSTTTGHSSVKAPWIEEVVVRCVCVLALEQYVDYSADGSIAPIRYLAAQIAGRFFTALPTQTTTVLVPLLQSTRSWHACHGALLAIQFLRDPSVQTKETLLTHVQQAIFRSEDEVFGAAAQCLVALAPHQNQGPSNVVNRLWAILSEDGAAKSVELASAHVLTALRHLHQPATLAQVDIVSAFLSHALVPVREAAIAWLSRALSCMTFDVRAGVWWLHAIWSRLLLDGPCQASLRMLWNQALDTEGLLPAASLHSIVEASNLTRWLHAAWSVGTPALTFKNLSAKVERVPLPATRDSGRAIVATQCLAQLHSKTVALAGVWSAWFCAALASPRCEEAIGALTLLSTTISSRSWPSQDAVEAVTTYLRNPRTTFYHEQWSGWELLRRQVAQMAAWFPSSQLKQLLAAGTAPSSTQSWQVAQVVAALPFESLTKPDTYTKAQHVRQDIFATEERVRLSFERAQATAGALYAATYLAWQLPWDKPAFLVRPLMEGLKTSPDARLQELLANTIVRFLHTCAVSHTVCCMKMITNLAAHLTATPTTLSRFRGAEMALTSLIQSIPPSFDDTSGPALLWAKLSSLWTGPHVPLLTIVLTHASPALVHPVLSQTWSWVNVVEHSSLAAAVATAAARSPDLMSQVVQLLRQAYSSAVMECLVQAHRSSCVPVVCDLIPLALTNTRGSALSGLIPLLPLHGHLDTASPFLYQLQTGDVPPLPDNVEWPPQLSLRPYQVDGINWLHFLASHRLHGILADDMGLGKTLQVLCSIVARKRTVASTNQADGLAATTPYMVLVVCPPIVMSHWVREAATYFAADFTSIVSYAGTASRRQTLRQHMMASTNNVSMTSQRGTSDDDAAAASKPADCTLVVTSYATLTQDRHFFHTLSFMYCVADEIQLCRNPATATAQALFGVRAMHRVAVSGTPIQNTPVDIWSVFSFLMPHYLGDAAAFRQKTVAPIVASRKASATSAQKEAGAVALTDLHAKIAPFVLRRTKESVLRDLPPKTIQDIPCALTPLQRQLYDAADSLDTSLATWRQRQQVCMHPKLVDEHLYADEASGKMTALVDLMQLVHGTDSGTTAHDREENRGDHRSLIFCHTPTHASLIQSILATTLPHLRLVKLDGSVPMAQRPAIVDEFNRDLSIHAMVLTTAIGGVGLNLVSADTVVFLEHSWNPFVDVQAMDRVHRLGQVNPVTVFRLLAQHTIEDEILTAQRLKQATADAILGPNEAKGHTNVLSVLGCGFADTDRPRPKKKPKSNQRTVQAMLEELGDLWDAAQYDSLALDAP